METKANHVLVGAFTLAFVFLVFGFVFWLARLDEAAGRQPIYVVFEGAVTGLGEGGAVLFNGIKVGEVSTLEFDPENPERVRALVFVRRNTPVKRDTTARLDAQGLTGVAVVQLLGGTKDSPPIGETLDNQIPVIRAEKSQFQDLVDSVRGIASKGASLFERLDKLLAKNEDTVTQSLENVRKVTDSLASNSGEIERFIKDAGELASRLNGTSKKLDDLIARTDKIVATDGEAFIKEAREAATTFKQLAENLNKGLGEGVSRVAGRSLREAEAFVVEGRTTLRNMQRVLDRLERSPKDFLLGGSRVPERGR
ncbi:MAG TPA: MlaD family protein [Hyphomicrobiales bacterium]|nr:MCE family protein [Rhodobiaceae bacterium]HXK54244.1 MlaD family protein [Hyphomicrobiales bacterium]